MKIFIAALIIILLIVIIYPKKTKKVYIKRSQTPMQTIQCPNCATVFNAEQPGIYEQYVERICPICDSIWHEVAE